MNEGHPQAGSPTAPARAHAVPPPVRAGSVAIVAASGAGAGLALAGDPLTQTRATLVDGTPWHALPLDMLLSCASAVALSGCCLWLLTVTVATALEAVTGVSSALVRALTPDAVRRGVLLTCGVAVGSAAIVGPATAATEAGPGTSLGGPAAAVVELDGLPLPDRSLGELGEPFTTDGRATPPRPRATRAGSDIGSGSGPGPGPGSGPDPGPGSARRAAESSLPPSLLSLSAHVRAATAAAPEQRLRARYQVRHGDSLWSIARRLRPRADLGEVDRTWRRVYRVNRPQIGHDPDLLIPGTTLRLPVRPAGTRRLDGPSGPDPLPHRKDAS